MLGYQTPEKLDRARQRELKLAHKPQRPPRLPNPEMPANVNEPPQEPHEPRHKQRMVLKRHKSRGYTPMSQPPLSHSNGQFPFNVRECVKYHEERHNSKMSHIGDPIYYVIVDAVEQVVWERIQIRLRMYFRN